ncbi:hypothetical protein J6590_010450 [Homalodisca vitripennis]|nr:hypothetical protein J6590_010450 [Homalodisca vitripennis]
MCHKITDQLRLIVGNILNVSASERIPANIPVACSSRCSGRVYLEHKNKTQFRTKLLINWTLFVTEIEESIPVSTRQSPPAQAASMLHQMLATCFRQEITIVHTDKNNQHPSI